MTTGAADGNNIDDDDDRDGMVNDGQRGAEDHDGHHHSTPNRRCEQLLAGWKRGATGGK
jgi:hypothetical protein